MDGQPPPDPKSEEKDQTIDAKYNAMIFAQCVSKLQAIMAKHPNWNGFQTWYRLLLKNRNNGEFLDGAWDRLNGKSNGTIKIPEGAQITQSTQSAHTHTHKRPSFLDETHPFFNNAWVRTGGLLGNLFRYLSDSGLKNIHTARKLVDGPI